MSYIKSKIQKLRQYFNLHPYKAYINSALIFAFIITVFIHTLECHSFSKGIAFIFANTYFFIVNYLIVLTTMLLSLLFKRRGAFMCLFALIWIVLGITNFIITIMRPMPLSGIDFVILTTTMDIIPHYLSVLEIILCVIGIIALIAASIYFIAKARKYERTLKYSVTPVICSAIILAAFIFGGALNGKLDISYADVKAAYDEHGFVYCFSSSLVDKGIPQPEDYSSNEVKEIIDKYSGIKSDTTITPNIIVVQLESFFDVAKYDKYTLNEDPIPNFHRLCDIYGEGDISVPSNGGGTVNTEFEVLTGMSLEFFGAVEYPYTTILKKETCESAPFILDDYGYTAHAIHNHTGVFYRRNEVYPNLGFDTFTPLEYMQYEKNELGWAKDNAILSAIKDALESTEGNDFIFAVTVEGHGLYDNSDREDIPFKVAGRDELSGSEQNSAFIYEYYCGLLNETDKFIGELYNYVMSSNEETVVILYGDHLPSLDFDASLYDCQSDYITQFTVFSNIAGKFSYVYDEITPAYRLLSTVFEELGIDGGIINLINRNHESQDYETDLEAVQYDMLYGEDYSGGDSQYTKKNMKFGCLDIEINEISNEDGFVTVSGNNFTKSSVIAINGWERDTEFIDRRTLKCSYSKLDDDDTVGVRQCAVDGKVLSETVFEN